MVITRLSLPRRTFLRGMGTSLALPLLDAMVPALTAAAQSPAAPVKRLGFVYVPNGTVPDVWVPATDGPGFALSPILGPLAPLRDRVLIVSGLAHRQSDSFGDGNGDHSRGASGWLSGVHAKRTEGGDVQNGPTIDQIAARELGKSTPLPSLELALEASEANVGNCDNGYSCVYSNTISWRSATAPVPMEVHPRVVFERLFGDGGSRAARMAELRQHRSILDSVAEELSSLQRGLGAADRTRVGEYLDTVREVERRIQKAEQQSDSGVNLPERPIDIPESFEEHAKLMFDLQVLAFQGDVTRIASLMMGREQSQRTYAQIGVPDPHHSVSHHRDTPDLVAKKIKIDTYHVQLLAYFLDRLQATPDGDGTLLDHAMVLYGTGMGNGNLHDHVNLPVVVAGGASGRLKTGRHLRYREETPMANLLLSLLDKVDVPLDRLGDSTGKLDIETLSGV